MGRFTELVELDIYAATGPGNHMIALSKHAACLWAKKSKPVEMTWLPLYRHLSDAVGVMRLLWNEWLPSGVRHMIAGNISEPLRAEDLALFLASAHDLGKATPVFQSKPRSFPQDDLDQQIMDEILAASLPIQAHAEFLNRSKTPHALATQIILNREGCDPCVSSILGAHHGKPVDSMALWEGALLAQPQNYHMGREGKEAWTAVQNEFLAYALHLSGIDALQSLPRPAFPAQVLLSALVIVADWIASNDQLFPYWVWDTPIPQETDSRVQAGWNKLQLPKAWRNDGIVSEPSYFMERFGIELPYLSQSEALAAAQGAAQPGILILEAPMGTGKTEAALVCAEVFARKSNRNGVFFALPTQATTNAIFPRLLAWTEELNTDQPYSVRLAHGKAQFNETYRSLFEGSSQVGDEEDRLPRDAMVHQWFEGNKKSLLADFVVGTIDQFLLSALRQKHVMLRHLGLAGKVVILDECHAYDAYMNQYLDRALEWMGAYGVPVIILSATLPAKRRADLVKSYLGATEKQCTARPEHQQATPQNVPPAWETSRGYPLITWTDYGRVYQRTVPGQGPGRTVLIKKQFVDGDVQVETEQLIEDLRMRLRDGGYAGIILNTVKRAQHFAQALQRAFGEDRVTLSHALFIAPDRAATEEKLLRMLGKSATDEERAGLHIVVGTQVIEQSLDLDFDLLVSDLCPMDLLLQRIGRLHRHQRKRHPGLSSACCIVLGAAGNGFEPGTKAVYGEFLLMRTLACLPDSLALPGDIPRLIQDVYDFDIPVSPEPANYQQAHADWTRLIAQKQRRATTYRIQNPCSDPYETLVGWMERSCSDTAGEASVRDGGSSVEVLLIRQTGDGLYSPLPWVNPCPKLYARRIPDAATARLLARQSLRLPAALCAEYLVDSTIRELEEQNRPLSCWQDSLWLKGMLFLILDRELKAELSGFSLEYRKDLGMIAIKEGKNE